MINIILFGARQTIEFITDKQMSKKTQNYLLAKTDLGEVKKGFHELPPEGHTYGKAPTKDKHGAREGIRFR